MNIIISIAIALELLAGVFILWGIFNEQTLLRIEKNLLKKIKNILNKSAKKIAVRKSRKLNRKSVYTPIKPEYKNRCLSENAA